MTIFNELSFFNSDLFLEPQILKLIVIPQLDEFPDAIHLFFLWFCKITLYLMY
jgi:hypothetical protein